METAQKPDPHPEPAPAMRDDAGLMFQGLLPPDPEPPPHGDAPREAPPGIELLEFVGRGGMGEVYLARQINLHRRVAVKFLAPEFASDAMFLSRLEREAQIMAQLRHPNLVGIHQFEWLPSGGAAIVMEWVEGGTLRDLLAQNPEGLPAPAAVALLRQVCSAVALAHGAGIIHRDLKPENVLLDSGGTPHVTDFGLALALTAPDTLITRSGTTVGTLEYMAPEQTRGRAVDARSDIYSLGVIFYEMLTGDLPRGHFDPPHVQRPAVPRATSTATMRALRSNPGERFATVQEFLQALEAPAPRGPGKLLWLGAALATVTLVGALAALNFRAPADQQAVLEDAPTPEPPIIAPRSDPPPAPAPIAEPAEEPVAPPAEPEPAPTLTPMEPEPERAPEPAVPVTPIPIAPTPAASAPAFAPSPAPPPQEEAWRDASERADLARSTVRGEWRPGPNGITSGSGVSILALSPDLPASYDVRTAFTRLEGRHSVALFFTQNGSMGSVELDAWETGLAGVQLVNGQDLRQNPGFQFPLQNGRRYELLVRVRPGTVAIVVDGVERGTYPTGTQPLGIVSPWAWNPAGSGTTLGLGTYESPTRFERFQWRPAND